MASMMRLQLQDQNMPNYRKHALQTFVIFISGFVAFLSTQAGATECLKDSIQRVAKDSNIGMPYTIETEAGQFFRIYGQDAINPMEWHSGESIQICPDQYGPQTLDVFNDRTGTRLVVSPQKKSARPQP